MPPRKKKQPAAPPVLLGRNGTWLRAKVRDVMQKAFAANGFTSEHVASTIAVMESGIFNHSIALATERGVARAWSERRYEWIYKDRARTIISNLRSGGENGGASNGRRLMQAVLAFEEGAGAAEGGLDAYDVGFAFTHRELMPTLYEQHELEVYARIGRAKQQRDMLEQVLSTGAGLVTCRKCVRAKRNPNRVTYSLLQTRSSDESSTAFFYCEECSWRWKGGG